MPPVPPPLRTIGLDSQLALIGQSWRDENQTDLRFTMDILLSLFFNQVNMVIEMKKV